MSENDFRPYPGDERPRGRTDFERLRTITDDEIEAAVRDDPDAVPLGLDWSKAELVIPPRKVAISIRVDEDVLNHFKASGAGYQRRMNAVLRAYMEARGR